MAQLLRGVKGRFTKLQEVFVSLQGPGNMRPSVTHELASGQNRSAHGRQLFVQGAVWADMLNITICAVSRLSACESHNPGGAAFSSACFQMATRWRRTACRTPCHPHSCCSSAGTLSKDSAQPYDVLLVAQILADPMTKGIFSHAHHAFMLVGRDPVSVQNPASDARLRSPRCSLAVTFPDCCTTGL